MGYTLLRRVFLLFTAPLALQKEPIIWREGTYSHRHIAPAAYLYVYYWISGAPSISFLYSYRTRI